MGSKLYPHLLKVHTLAYRKEHLLPHPDQDLQIMLFMVQIKKWLCIDKTFAPTAVC